MLPSLVNLFLFGIAFTAVTIGIPAVLFWRNRARFARIVDRYQIRPSLILAAIRTNAGILILICIAFLRPSDWILQAIGALLATLHISSGVERIYKPPTVEYRPHWYVGEGNPAWLDPTDKPKPTLRISLAWISIASLVLCISLALISSTWRAEWAATKAHHVAVSRVVELGGTVQQGFVSLAGNRDLGDAELACLADLRDVLDLNLASTAITNDGLKHIQSFAKLRVLNLSGTDVTDAGLRHLAACRRLHTLHLRKTPVTGKAFPLASGVPLSSLDVSLCPIDAEGLRCIARASLATYLSLAETDVGDSMLEQLQAMETLQLDLRQTNVSRAGYDSLNATRPVSSHTLWSGKKRAALVP